MSQSQSNRCTSDATAPTAVPPPDPACPKCGGQTHREETIRTTGDDWSRFLDMQRFRFRARICEQCGYTELYSRESNWGDNAWDLLFGG
ncbi:MAG: zinc ribbon domain-containing protein [Caldilineaceae bacterium]|nr:zinc ribbon domain-containing protein [Caldilineaceae bacterium]